MNTAPPLRDKPVHSAARMLLDVWSGWGQALGRLGSPRAAKPALVALSRPRPLQLQELEPASVASSRRSTDVADTLVFPEPVSRTHEAVTLPPLALKTHRDALTGLASRDYLNDNADSLLQALRSSDTEVCILRVGIDGLDSVTERYGQCASDQVLLQVAKRLRQLAREKDVVMRLHGAEFALLVACPAHEAAAFARTLSARVLADMKRPFSWRTLSNLRVCGCVGSAVWPTHGATLDEVMGYADHALALARSSGTGQTRQFVGRLDNLSQAAAA